MRPNLTYFGFSRVPPVRNWGQKCVSFLWKSHFKTRLGPKYLNLHPKNKDFEHFSMDFKKSSRFSRKRKLFIRLRFKIIESASKLVKRYNFLKRCVFWIKELFLIKKWPNINFKLKFKLIFFTEHRLSPTHRNDLPSG